MKKQAGVWIDHREAIVVSVADSEPETTRIESGFESQPRRSSDQDSGTFESMQVQSDDTRERKKQADLNHFYDQVIAQLSTTDSIFIFGPGEARVELKKRMDEKRLSAACVLEAADKMTQPQIVAKVTQHFKKA